VACEPDEEKAAPARPICPRCFQMQAVSGACGCDE
jgi:hypothetical protein